MWFANLPWLFFRCYTFKAGSYIYVNSPMINRHEWHPFSIIQVPGTAKATFYAEAVSERGTGEKYVYAGRSHMGLFPFYI